MIPDPERLPAVGPILAAGPDDPVFDWYILTAPLLVGTVAVVGRHRWLEVAVVVYVGAFVLYLGYKALSRTRTE